MTVYDSTRQIGCKKNSCLCSGLPGNRIHDLSRAPGRTSSIFVLWSYVLIVILLILNTMPFDMLYRTSVGMTIWKDGYAIKLFIVQTKVFTPRHRL